MKNAYFDSFFRLVSPAKSSSLFNVGKSATLPEMLHFLPYKCVVYVHTYLHKSSKKFY